MDKTQERKGSDKALLPQNTSFQWHAGRHRQTGQQTHMHPNSRPSSITTAIVKAVTPRKLANDVPTQGFLPKGLVTSILLLASPKSFALLHKPQRLGFPSFPGRGSPRFGEGNHQAALTHSNPTPNIFMPF